MEIPTRAKTTVKTVLMSPDPGNPRSKLPPNPNPLLGGARGGRV